MTEPRLDDRARRHQRSRPRLRRFTRGGELLAKAYSGLPASTCLVQIRQRAEGLRAGRRKLCRRLEVAYGGLVLAHGSERAGPSQVL